MLSPIRITETIEVPYMGNGAAGFPVVSFDLPTNEPFLLSSIGYTITAGATTLLSSFTFRDETGTSLFVMPVIPWQFAGTTISNTMMQTPDPNNVPLFATQILAGFIPKEFHVFNGWTVSFSTFGGDPGDTIVSVFTLSKLWRK